MCRRHQSNNEEKLKKQQSLPKSNVIPIPRTPESKRPPPNGYKTPPRDYLSPYPQKSKYSKINCSEVDSLDSNYYNKSSFQSAYQVSQENLQYNDLGLSLPNYYPDSKYDTDISVTAENVSIFSDTDFYDGNSRSLPNYAYEYDSSLSDLEPRYYESNTFNPIFSEYDYSVSDSCSELNNFDEITIINNKSKDTDSVASSVANQDTIDSKIVDYDKTLDLKNDDQDSQATSSRTSTLKGSAKINIFDSDDVKFNEENSFDTTDNNTEQQISIIEISDTETEKNPDFQGDTKSLQSEYSTVHASSSSQDYVTLITIDNNNPEITPKPERKKSKSDLKRSNSKKTKSPTDIKRQSYLKELLDSSTSKKPLKNFITKNITRAFGDKDSWKKSNKPISTENYVTTIVENQFYSLPDINASKYLEKCEKIDRKLRKCEKLTRTKSSADNSKNRFVVNIGQHFNIPNQKADIPVDFEVKISKVPKIRKTPTKSNSFAGRNTTSITIKSTDKNAVSQHTNETLQIKKEEHKLSNFSTLTKQTKEKLLAGFKKTVEVKSHDKLKIKPLPKITEVIEKKEEDTDEHEEIKTEKREIRTIRNFTKIDEKPENKYNSYSSPNSLDYVNTTEQTYTSLPIDIPSTTENKTNHLRLNTDVQQSQSLPKMDTQANKNNEITNGKSSPPASPVQEFKDKLDTMRNFWDKMMVKANDKPETSSEQKQETETQEKEVNNHITDSNIIHESPPPKVTISRFESMTEQQSKPQIQKPEPCKIVEVQSKIENVRKIFEPNSEKTQDTSPSLVETNRKIFEPRLSEKFEDKMGTFVKDSCGIFENPYFDRFNSISPSYTTSDSSNQFESLNPNIVEIIESEKEKQKARETRENIKNNVSNCRNNQNDMNSNKPKDEKQTRIINGTSKPKGTALIKSKSFDQGPEFDHVRYKVMKSELFQKNIFANYEKETQFDGLMQYLQDYSFQELLIDNNIVIIEPIRTKVEFSDAPKKTKKITQLIPKPEASDNKETKQSVLRRHFFYHPIRVNREVNDSELPNPDTVKQVRQFFESTGIMKKSHSHKELDNPPKKKTIRYQTVIDPDRDHCSESDTSSEKSTGENCLVEENGFESLQNDNTCCEKQYVSQDVLKKIRECGTCVTYYGGKVLEANNNKHTAMTKAIMEEIKGLQKKNEECGCRRRDKKDEKKNADKKNKLSANSEKRDSLETANCKIIEEKITFKPNTKTAEQKPNNKEVYQGIKFKLIKSNSCSSRLELVGTENVSEYRKKFLERQKNIIHEQNMKNQQITNGTHEKIELLKEIKECLNNESVTADLRNLDNKMGKDMENGTDKMEKSQKPHSVEESPKIVAEEKKVNGNKMTQWGLVKEEKTSTPPTKKEPKGNYIDYKDYEKMRHNSRKFNDMEFESYEVLE